MIDYVPLAGNSAPFGDVATLLAGARTISNRFDPAPRLLAALAGGQIYFDGPLKLDVDGWAGGSATDPGYEVHTNLRYAGGGHIDTGRIPAFTLPLPMCWANQQAIRTGDYAAVLSGDRLAFAVFADSGPKESFSEGSIALFRQLGRDPLGADGLIVDAHATLDVVMIIFPGSRAEDPFPDETALLDGIARGGRAALAALTAAPVVPGARDIGPGLADRIADAARAELARYGGPAAGGGPLAERIEAYRTILAEPDAAAGWSASFVSYMAHLAGAGDLFFYHDRHAKLYHPQVHNRDRQVTRRFWTYRPWEIQLAPGDIVLSNRPGLRIIDFPQGRASDDYPGCTDIVVESDEQGLRTVGGDVGPYPGRIGEKLFRWDGPFLRNIADPRQSIYAVLRAPGA